MRIMRDNGSIITNIDWKELIIFLSDNIEYNILNKSRLSQLLPKNKPVIKNPTIDDYIWHETSPGIKISPNQLQINQMQGLLANVIIQFIMTNHLYMVGQTIYKQSKGGPTGLDITRVVTRVAMLVFGKERETHPTVT